MQEQLNVNKITLIKAQLYIQFTPQIRFDSIQYNKQFNFLSKEIEIIYEFLCSIFSFITRFL